jgi:hypothetical protein
MLAVQRDLGRNLVAEIDYNGSHSDHLYIQTDVNRFPGDLIVNKGKRARLNPNFGPIIYGRTIGVADGHYGTFMLSKRFSHSWSFRGIFTFGNATDYMSSNDNGTSNGETVFNALDVPAQHAKSDYAISRRFTVDSRIELPTLFKSGFGKHILGGWRMSNIVVLQSGLPFTVYTSAPFNPIFDANGNVVGLKPGSGDFNADGYNYDTPNAPVSWTNISTGSRSAFIRGFAPVSAFSAPALGTQGNLGRNTFRGPGLANVNTGFTKVAKFEHLAIEFRADVFNLFNRVNLTQPNSDLSSSQFGRSTGQNIPRYAQFGIHLDF